MLRSAIYVYGRKAGDICSISLLLIFNSALGCGARLGVQFFLGNVIKLYSGPGHHGAAAINDKLFTGFVVREIFKIDGWQQFIWIDS